MTKALYLEDSYLRECDATVVSARDGKYVVLDQTIFYSKGGGSQGIPAQSARGTGHSMMFTLVSSPEKSRMMLTRPG